MPFVLNLVIIWFCLCSLCAHWSQLYWKVNVTLFRLAADREKQTAENEASVISGNAVYLLPLWIAQRTLNGEGRKEYRLDKSASDSTTWLQLYDLLSSCCRLKYDKKIKKKTVKIRVDVMMKIKHIFCQAHKVHMNILLSMWVKHNGNGILQFFRLH